MKKGILVLAVLLLPSLALAEFHGEIEAGYDLYNRLWEYSIEADIGDYMWELYPHVFAGWYTLTEMESLTNWLPWVQVYKVGAGVKMGRLDLTYTHYCMHPVDLGREVLYDYKDFVFQAADKISLKYSW